MKRIIVLIFLFLPILLNSQNSSVDKKTGEDWKVNSEKFRLEAIVKDLISADLNRLKSIAMSLGLPEMENVAEYRKAIADYYKIELINNPVKKKSGDKIEIKRAGELKYLKFTEEDEENIHISGRARIELFRKDNNEKSYIEADEIYINTKNREITGIGNVIYKDDRLEYQGSQFYYNYETNKGVLFTGRTQLKKGGDSGLDGAFFTGEKVLKTGDDDIILSKGMLTTCEETNPHYYIKVTRLWVGEKGEWGLLNGVVFIGHVPFFYFPIYYHPKNLVINPAFGFRPRHGWFINTTYYLFGERETEEESSSSTSDRALVQKRRKVPTSSFRIKREEVNRKLEEFYERNDFYKKYPNLRHFPKYDYIDVSLNFFSDAYTNLGFYTGMFFYLKSQFPNNPFKIMLLSDYAFSKKLWKDPSLNVYYPYKPDDAFIYDSTSTYYNVELNPFIFRQSQWLKVDGSFLQDRITFNYDIQFEYVTDKYYFQDFYKRRDSFTYIDILADALSSVANKQGTSAFKSTETEENVTNDYTTTRSYVKLNFSPVVRSNNPTIFNLFGLPLISKMDFNIEINSLMTATEVKSIPDDGSYNNPKRNRYLLSFFSLPGAMADDGSELSTNTVSIAGTLVDYETFLTMPGKYKKYKEEISAKKSKEISKEEYLFKDIEAIAKIDNSSDTTELDFKKLLPFYSKKYIPIAKSDTDGKRYKNIIPFEEEKELKKDEIKQNLSFNYDNIESISKISIVPSTLIIIPFKTTLRYEANERIVNRFIFEPKTDIISSSIEYRDTDEYDTLQSLLISTFDKNYYIDFSKFLKRLNIRNFIDFKIENPTKFMLFNNQGLWEMSPAIKVTNRRYYDYEQFYIDYLTASVDPEYSTSGVRDELDKVIREDMSSTDLLISYSDMIVNNLSFGLYRFSGTSITTNIGVDLYKYNHLRENNYRKFNILNSDKQVDPVFYFNRVTYDRLTALDTTFKFSYNFFPEKSSHYLNFSISSKINWKIPSSTLQELKDELWLNEVINNVNNDIVYDSSTVEEAKEYLYYREKGGINLIDKIWGTYYGHFITREKYIRKMFENVAASLSYKFKYKEKEIVGLGYNLTFVLENIGNFSDIKDKKDGTREAYVTNKIAVWPNHIFAFSLFNSMFQYNMNITYKKAINTFYKTTLTTTDTRLDEYNIITMENAHSFIFRLRGDLFELPDNSFTAKIKSSNWVTASTTFVFKWDKTLNGIATDVSDNIWADASRYNYFYLDSQVIGFSSLLDIFKASLTFKKYNFKEYGYGLEMERGEFSLGYNITEIPVFLRYFKLTVYPQFVFKFYLRHSAFYDSKVEYEYGPEYATYNTMTANLDINLAIAKGSKYETNVKFSILSENRKMYNYYTSGGVGLFFQDIADSFDFSDTDKRRRANFKLKSVSFTLEHLLCDWKLQFIYTGSPVKNDNRYTWESIFEFYVTWQMSSKNQLMKMFNKSKLNAVYNRDENNNSTGEWRQPILSLDPDQE